MTMYEMSDIETCLYIKLRVLKRISQRSAISRKGRGVPAVALSFFSEEALP